MYVLYTSRATRHASFCRLSSCLHEEETCIMTARNLATVGHFLRQRDHGRDASSKQGKKLIKRRLGVLQTIWKQATRAQNDCQAKRRLYRENRFQCYSCRYSVASFLHVFSLSFLSWSSRGLLCGDNLKKRTRQ